MPSPFKFRPSENPAPGGTEAAHRRWHQETRLRAIGAIALSGGFIAGRELAKLLGMSPHGLRQFLLNSEDEAITVEMRGDEGGRGEPWYRLNPACIRDHTPPPLLADHRPTTTRFRLRRVEPGNCGPDDLARNAPRLT